jgi:hypothetical protein
MNKPALEDILSDCLHETLNIMVCSDSGVFRQTIDAILHQHRPYSLYNADSPESMDQLFRGLTAWHTVIIERNGKPAGEFLKRVWYHHSWLPVIVVYDVDPGDELPLFIDKPDAPAVFNVRNRNGGREAPSLREDIVIIPCSLRDGDALRSVLQIWSIKRKLFGIMPRGLVQDGIEMLFQRNPDSLNMWATLLNTTQRKFQRLFKPFTNLSPKKMLAVYQAYQIVFAKIDGKIRGCKTGIPTYLADHHSKQRIIEYVLTRRSSLLLK